MNSNNPFHQFPYKRSLLAVAVAACSSAAYAQTPCDSQISEIEQQIAQSEVDPQKQTEVQDLLRAAQQNASECDVYVSRAEEVINRGESAQTQTAQPTIRSTTQEQPGQQTRQQREQQVAGQSGQTSEPQQASEPQQTQQQAGQQTDRTMDIQVDQAPAQVDVQTRAPQIVVKQQPAEITVEQKPPEIEITQSEPEITVEQPEPEVTVNRAEPDVQVSQSEPEVEVRQSEPNVRVVQPEATAQVRTEGEQQSARQSSAQQASQSGQQSSQVDLAKVEGNQALSSEGEEIGEVQQFVRARDDGSSHVLVAAGGVLGLGERTIAIPLDQVSLSQDGNLQTQLSQDQIDQQEEYDEQRFEEVPQSEFAALEAELSQQQ